MPGRMRAARPVGRRDVRPFQVNSGHAAHDPGHGGHGPGKDGQRMQERLAAGGGHGGQKPRDPKRRHLLDDLHHGLDRRLRRAELVPPVSVDLQIDQARRDPGQIGRQRRTAGRRADFDNPIGESQLDRLTAAEMASDDFHAGRLVQPVAGTHDDGRRGCPPRVRIGRIRYPHRRIRSRQRGRARGRPRVRHAVPFHRCQSPGACAARASAFRRTAPFGSSYRSRSCS